MDIGVSINRIRKKKGVNQKELSESSGVSQSYLSSIENGKRVPEFRTIEMICQSLDITVADLMILSLDDDDIRDSQLRKIQSLKKELLDEIL